MTIPKYLTEGSAKFIISLILLGFWGAYEYAVLFMKMPKDEGMQTILNAMVIWVSGFWIGSSNSSQNKDATIAQSAANTAAALETRPPNPDGSARR